MTPRPAIPLAIFDVSEKKLDTPSDNQLKQLFLEAEQKVDQVRDDLLIEQGINTFVAATHQQTVKNPGTRVPEGVQQGLHEDEATRKVSRRDLFSVEFGLALEEFFLMSCDAGQALFPNCYVSVKSSDEAVIGQHVSSSKCIFHMLSDPFPGVLTCVKCGSDTSVVGLRRYRCAKPWRMLCCLVVDPVSSQITVDLCIRTSLELLAEVFVCASRWLVSSITAGASLQSLSKRRNKLEDFERDVQPRPRCCWR